jgi:hypothetical protein
MAVGTRLNPVTYRPKVVKRVAISARQPDIMIETWNGGEWLGPTDRVCVRLHTP